MGKFKAYFQDLIAVLSIIVFGLLVLQGFSERVDINLTDDTGYLVLGTRITSMILAGFGPLYSVMFKVLKPFTADHVMLYDLVMHLMYILPPIAAYLMMRVVGLRLIPALLLSIGFMFSPNIISFITWSKISHYTIMIVMLWVIFVVKKVKSVGNLLFALVVLTFLLGYIRPESHLSWYIATFLFISYSVWNYRNKGLPLPKFKLAISICVFSIFIGLTAFSSVKVVGLINTLVNPMSGGRSNIAFAQQFSYNYCEWNDLDHFDWIQWRDISKKNFGDFNTLGEAFKNNPNVFVKHIIYNIERYIVKFSIGVQSIFFPPAVFKWSTWLSSLLVLFILLGKVFYVGWSNWWMQFSALFKKYVWVIASLLIIGLPSIIASVIFYTREHYLLLIMPLVLFLLTLFFLPRRKKEDRTPRIVTYLSLPITLMLVYFVHPDLKDYKTYDVWEEYTYPSNRKTIQFLKAMNIDQEVREIDHEGGFATYLGKSFKWINIIAKEEQSYSEFAEEHQPNMYYVTKSLLSNRFLNQDPEFMKIIEDPESYNFRRVDLPEANKGYLLVHDTIKFNPR